MYDDYNKQYKKMSMPKYMDCFSKWGFSLMSNWKYASESLKFWHDGMCSPSPQPSCQGPPRQIQWADPTELGKGVRIVLNRIIMRRRQNSWWGETNKGRESSPLLCSRAGPALLHRFLSPWAGRQPPGDRFDQNKDQEKEDHRD